MVVATPSQIPRECFFSGCLSLESLTTMHGDQSLQRHSFEWRRRCYHHNISPVTCDVGDQAYPLGQVPRRSIGCSDSGAKPSRSRRRCADARSMESGGRGALAAPRRGRARRLSPRQGARCTPKYYRCASFFFFYVSRELQGRAQVCATPRNAPLLKVRTARTGDGE